MTDPVFLVGARRSGTTLFRLMLDGHPRVTWTRGWEAVADAIAHFSSGNRQPFMVSLDGFEPFSAESGSDLKKQLEQIIERRLSEQGKRIIGATAHVGFAGLPTLWPSAKFIHLVRDPRDIAISFMTLGWVGHYYFAPDAWIEAEQDWDRLKHELRDGQYIELRYEDLIAEPNAELGRICGFLGIEFNDHLFDYVKTSKYGFPKKELAYRWKKKLTDKQAMLIESRVGSLMTERGYEPSTPIISYSAWQIMRFKFSNTWTRRRRRIREHGLVFVLLHRLARLLNWKYLDRRVDAWETARHKRRLSELEKNY